MPAGIPEFLILVSSTCLLSESGDFGHFSVQLRMVLKLCGGPDFKDRSVWVFVLPLPLVMNDRAKDGSSDTGLEREQKSKLFQVESGQDQKMLS